MHRMRRPAATPARTSRPSTNGSKSGVNAGPASPAGSSPTVATAPRLSCCGPAPCRQSRGCCRRSRCCTNAAPAAAIGRPTSAAWRSGLPAPTTTTTRTGCGARRSPCPPPGTSRSRSRARSAPIPPGATRPASPSCPSSGNKDSCRPVAHRRVSATERWSAACWPSGWHRSPRRPRRRGKRLATDRDIPLSEIGQLDAGSFRLFLTLLGEALAAQRHPDQPVERMTGDGSLAVRLVPLAAPYARGDRHRRRHL